MSNPSRRAPLILLLAFAAFTAVVRAAEPEVAEAPLTAREQAIVDRVDRLAKSMSGSSDLAIRILYSIDGLDEQPDKTWRFHEVVPLATLLDQGRGSTDPLVLDLLLWRCSVKGANCDRIDLATRWTQADTQNQLAWLALATAQRQAGDVEGSRETVVRASQASVWHDYYDDAIRRGARALPLDLTGPERLAALRMVFAKAGVVVAFEAMHTLGDSCKGAGPSRDTCAHILEAMARDGNMMALNVAVPYAARAALPLSTIANIQQKADAISWGMQRMYSGRIGSWDTVEVDDSPALRQSLRTIETRIDCGERGSVERFLADQHITEADAARARVASLSESLVARRLEMLKARDAREAELRGNI